MKIPQVGAELFVSDG